MKLKNILWTCLFVVPMTLLFVKMTHDLDISIAWAYAAAIAYSLLAVLQNSDRCSVGSIHTKP